MSKIYNTEDRKEKQDFWATHIDGWKKSGLTQAEYCRRFNLKSYQLSYWFNRKPRRVGSLPALVEIPLRENVSQIVSDPGLQLVTKYGERININDNFSVESFEKVMLVLRRLS